MPRKRGKSWYTDFYFEGGRHRQRIPGARVRHEAVQAETKIKNELFQKTYGPPILKDKPLAKFVEEDFLPWAENNKKQPRHDRGVTRIWLELPSLKGKTVREVSQFDIESAKVRPSPVNLALQPRRGAADGEQGTHHHVEPLSPCCGVALPRG